MPVIFWSDSWTILWFLVDGWGKRCGGCTALQSAANPKFCLVNGKSLTREFHSRWHHPIRWQWTKAYYNSQESPAALALALFVREQVNQHKLRATRNSFTVRGLCIDRSIILFTPCMSCVSSFRFRLQKYANAREAVHAVSSEASWYYELPCFCSCIKNY